MQDSLNCLQRKPEVGQGIFRDKMKRREWGREASSGFEELFVDAEGIMVLGLHFFFFYHSFKHYRVQMFTISIRTGPKGQSAV